MISPDVEDLQNRFLEKLYGVLLSLQTDRRFSDDRLSEIEQTAEALCCALKPYPDLPKAFLSSWRQGIGIARAEAPHLPEHAPRLLAFADTLDAAFGRVLLGESAEDRAPGAFRIV